MSEVAAADQLPLTMLERATAVMELFHSPDRHLTLGQIAVHTHLPRATVHRIVRQLMRLEWLTHGAGGYTLGRRVRTWAPDTARLSRLRTCAAPVLHELLLATTAVVHLGALQGGEVLYLDKLGGRAASAVPTGVGTRTTAHRSTLGRVCLAQLSPEDIEHRTTAVAPDVDLAALHRRLRRIDHRATDYDDNEFADRLGSVAVAVDASAAIAVVCDRPSALRRIAPRVRAAAAEIRAELTPGPRQIIDHHPPLPKR
ncbi:IclR family transcriptional regulator [Nocardia vermiculata]|uniref:Helix-turn-helix domain-containing protein n=1 Tax=Nocardia vermiculata TaxID=257274 RepID=A0A846XUI9_9NOCA|nr:helix-turn-helix domain-containing protein [Nocardia vermiculata]NKY48768.1 helix-turn-helix domain-containing protein [Nocardia vermiculata]